MQKKVLEYCKNYNNIINAEFLEDDELTKKLIEYYQSFVFSINLEDATEIVMIKELDDAMNTYIEDYHFCKYLKNSIEVEKVLDDEFPYMNQLMKFLIRFFKDYKKEKVRKITQTKWV